MTRPTDPTRTPLAAGDKSRDGSSLTPLDYDALGTVHPKLARGRVWCRKCGFTFSFKTSTGLQHGWPKCCRETMTIDSPEERLPDSAASLEGGER